MEKNKLKVNKQGTTNIFPVIPLLIFTLFIIFNRKAYKFIPGYRMGSR